MDDIAHSPQYFRNRKWRKANPEKVAANSKRWRTKNPDYHTEQARKWREQPGVRARLATNMRDRCRARRTKILLMYGGNPPSCANCGIGDNRVLTIDHINGNGTKQLHQFKWVGQYYDWIVKEKRNGLQILCMNCQWIKRHTNHEVGPNSQEIV